MPQARYEKVIEAFGGDGYFVETPDQLRPTLEKAFAANKPERREHHDQRPGAAEAAAVRLAHAVGEYAGVRSTPARR